MEIGRLFNAILRKLWLVMILAVIGGSAAWYVNEYMTSPQYDAEATIYALNRSKAATTGGGLNYQDVVTGRQLLQDYAGIINSRKVASIAMGELHGMNLNEDMVSRMVAFDLRKDSSVMEIHALSGDPKIAAAVANAMSRAFSTQIRELTMSEIVGVFDEAKVPVNPIPVDRQKNLLIGVLVGILAALGIIYTIELFDTTIRAAEDVESHLKLHVIGLIPEHNIH